MNFLSRWLFSLADKMRGNVPANSMLEKSKSAFSISPSRSSGISSIENQIRFTVIPARGGLVITVFSNNENTGYENQEVHVIPDDQDISTNIGHIISLAVLSSK